MKALITIAVSAILVLTGYFFFFRTTPDSQAISRNTVSSVSSPSPVPPSPPLDITTDDVRAAGFVGTIRQEMPTETMYHPPALYFRVGDNHSNQVSDLLMVSQVMIVNPDEPLFSYGSSTVPFIIPGGRGQEAITIDGRTVVNFIKNHEYVVVMGPVPHNIEQLALMIAGRRQ